jgi:hypothetical protein
MSEWMDWALALKAGDKAECMGRLTPWDGATVVIVEPATGRARIGGNIVPDAPGFVATRTYNGATGFFPAAELCPVGYGSEPSKAALQFLRERIVAEVCGGDDTNVAKIGYAPAKVLSILDEEIKRFKR